MFLVPRLVSKRIPSPGPRLTKLPASVLSRNWAKLNKAHFDITDSHLTLDQLSYRGEGSDEIGPYM